LSLRNESTSKTRLKILVAPDKFKGTITAPEIVGITTRILEKNSYLTIGCPLADGGDGTAQILTANTGGREKTVTVEGPDFTRVKAKYGINDSTQTAYIEMASASGLSLLPETRRNPAITSTTGTGMLLKDAVAEGCKHVILGVGGSATNDGGMGVAHIFGYTFLDEHGQSLSPVGNNLKKVNKIIPPETLPQIKIEVAVDVQNPFYGPLGAAQTYAEQKGASPAEIEELDKGLRNLAKKYGEALGVDVAHMEGAGAAGGLAGGLVACLGAELKSGISLVMKEVDFDKKLSECDLVISGEGKLDDTSFQGKVVGEVIARARSAGKKWLIISGRTDIEGENIFSLEKIAGNAREAMQNPTLWIEKTLEFQVLPYLIQADRKS